MADGAGWLFSYGTLQQPEVQRALFGRELAGVSDTLIGFEITMITITDPKVVEQSGSDRHPCLKRSSPDRSVPGSAFLMTEDELQAADRYEAAHYVRAPVTLASGRAAFVYLPRDDHP